MRIKAGRIWLTTWKTCSRTSEKNIKLFLVNYLPGRLCRLLDRTWHNGYPVRSAPAQLSPGVGDAGHALLAQGILPRRCACTVDVSPSDAVAISLSAGFLSQ